MGEGIFRDFSCGGIQAAQSILLKGVVPNHVIAIDADGVRAWRRSRQVKLLDASGLRIEVADLAADAFSEPDGPIGIHYEALRFALCRRVPLCQFTSFGDP